MGAAIRERRMTGGASPHMADLDALLERLRAEQHDLIREADDAGSPPSRLVLQRIAELESTIRSVESLIEDR